MSIDEVITEITSQPKYYIGVMPQGHASNFMMRYKAGIAKQSTVIAFIEKFGYELKKPATYGPKQKETAGSDQRQRPGRISKKY